MKAIAAVNKLGWIGNAGKLMWHSPEDLKHFKKTTMGKKCLVGRTTYENMPDLPGREMIVVGKGYHTLSEAMALEPDFVIGGAKMYKSTMHLIDEFLLSIIDDEQIGDVRLPHIPFNVKITVNRF